MPARVIAIGDIHGCAMAFEGLLRLIAPTSEDTLVILGDCIDRGPDSRGVFRLMLELEEQCRVIPILGNHEEMFLAAVDRPSTTDDWLVVGGRETLKSYGVAQADQVYHEHLLYLRTWGDYWETDGHFFCHGSYDPRVALDRQEWGYQRWQSLRGAIPDPHLSGKQAVVGHTSQKDGSILDVGHLICIDTYCCGGKWLTAYDVAGGCFWQVDPDGNPRTDCPG